ncbi:MAG: site-specific integrase [Lachnospiraceae bacterium]|nr:site-specific integrase [Lachnospiraceae bacterium]
MSDIKNNIIHIHRDMVTDRRHKWVIKEIPKTEKSARFVDMPEEVIAEIRKQGYVTKMTPRQIYKAFKRLLQKNGLDDFTFHDMRHWCVSTLHAHGMPDAYIQHRGGWSSDRIMKQVYLQTLQDQSEILTDKAMSHLIQCCK